MTKNESTCCPRSECAIANTLDVLGDRWTLLVIRDMLWLGKAKYGELLESPEGISTNILADRLKKLEAFGIVEKTPYKRNPLRYEYRLTDKGLDLKPVLLAMTRWGKAHVPGTLRPSHEMAED